VAQCGVSSHRRCGISWHRSRHLFSGLISDYATQQSLSHCTCHNRLASLSWRHVPSLLPAPASVQASWLVLVWPFVTGKVRLLDAVFRCILPVSQMHQTQTHQTHITHTPVKKHNSSLKCGKTFDDRKILTLHWRQKTRMCACPAVANARKSLISQPVGLRYTRYHMTSDKLLLLNRWLLIRTVTDNDSLGTFKSRLKTFLFSLAFNWHWHYPPPVPLKLRPNGVMQIYYYYYYYYIFQLSFDSLIKLRKISHTLYPVIDNCNVLFWHCYIKTISKNQNNCYLFGFEFFALWHLFTTCCLHQNKCRPTLPAAYSYNMVYGQITLDLFFC